jgi:integrase
VRFRWGGEDIERSTGTREPERAADEAARIYARVIASPKRQRVAARVGDLEGAITRWIESLEGRLDPRTLEGYATYGSSHWIPFFIGLHRLTDAEAIKYMQLRLSRVVADTVKKELSALRGFCRWATSEGLLPPMVIPAVPKRTTGTPHKHRRRAAAIELSPTEVQKIIRALPEWSSSPRVPPFPVRARFQVAYETGLRPELVALLSVPENYRRGARSLNITKSLDKGRWARRVPLSAAARKALDRVCPADGTIFGMHDCRTQLRRAATKALPPERAEIFTGAHLRSARATHWLDKGAPLTGVQFLLGHLRTDTTAKYIRPSERAAKAVLKKR